MSSGLIGDLWPCEEFVVEAASFDTGVQNANPAIRQLADRFSMVLVASAQHVVAGARAG
jgi:hypothetical protein